jgi:hypothetical protein
MATEGFEGFYVETRNYGATAAFWSSLGFANVFESDHGSGQFVHPAGGPYVFINEQLDEPLVLQPILRVTDATAFQPERQLDYERPFEPQHWGVAEALVRDPDGRSVALQAPIPEGMAAPDADAHHHEAYGST